MAKLGSAEPTLWVDVWSCLAAVSLRTAPPSLQITVVGLGSQAQGCAASTHVRRCPPGRPGLSPGTHVLYCLTGWLLMAKELLWNDCLPPLTQQWGQKQPRPGMWGRLEGTIAWISGPLGWAHQNTATVLNVPVGGLGPLCLGYLRQIQHDLPLPVQRAPEEKSASSFPGVSSICALSNHSISSHPYKCVASHMPGPSILGGWPCSSYNKTAEVQNSPSHLGKTPVARPLSQARLRLPSGSLGQSAEETEHRGV